MSNDSNELALWARVAKWFLHSTGLTVWAYHVMNALHPAFEALNPANLAVIRDALRVAPAGDYYEFGVYKGFSLWWAQQMARTLDRERDMMFYGFDSFAGFPTSEGRDLTPDRNGNTYAAGALAISKETVAGFLQKYGANMLKVRLIEGFFSDSLKPRLRADLQMGRAAVVLMDCDLYQSTVEALTFVTPLLQRGTIIIMDDWSLWADGVDAGQQAAWRAWIGRSGVFCRYFASVPNNLLAFEITETKP